MSCTQSQNFSAKIFFLIWASFKCYFWIHHLKIMSGTNFHENIIRHSNYWRKCFPMIFKDGLFQKEWGDFGPNLWHPYLGNHSGYNAQIWLFSLSLRYEPLCQISWFFFESMGFRPLLSALFDVKFPLIIVRRTSSSYQALI